MGSGTMGLEERLRRLRPQSGAQGPNQGAAPRPDPEGPVPAVPSLAERLRRLAPDRRAWQPRVPDEPALAAALGADRLEPGVLRIERRLAARLRHGRVLLGAGIEPRFLPGWTDGVGVSGPATPWLCLDTETSGLAGGTGTWAFLTGFLRQDIDGWRLCQLLLTRLDAEAAYLERVAGELDGSGGGPARLLSYNGRGFDAPLLATRFRLAGRPDPLAGLPHLDLLAPMRRAFTAVWPDCRLATAESRLLGFARRDDLPGAAAPQAWLGWLRRGETGPLAGVIRHNRLDLLSLAGLLPALDAVYGDPGARGADPRAVAAAHLAGGNAGLALEILAANRGRLDPPGLLDLARLYRRTGQWGRAAAIWSSLDAAGIPEARAALARYHEHHSRDLDLALSLTRTLPPGADREQRLTRLLAKRDRRGLTRRLDLG